MEKSCVYGKVGGLGLLVVVAALCLHGSSGSLSHMIAGQLLRHSFACMRERMVGGKELARFLISVWFWSKTFPWMDTAKEEEKRLQATKYTEYSEFASASFCQGSRTGNLHGEWGGGRSVLSLSLYFSSCVISSTCLSTYARHPSADRYHQPIFARIVNLCDIWFHNSPPHTTGNNRTLIFVWLR